MRRTQVLFGALAAAGSCPALALPASADDTGWITFADRCHAELKPDWAAQAAKGRKWDADSTQNLAKLQELTDRICPEYFKRPNDAAAIRAFSASKAAILDQSPVVDKNGDALIAFLQAGYLDYASTFVPLGVDFPSSPCGQQIRETKLRTEARLVKIRAFIQKLAKTCFAVTGQENAAALKAHSPGVHGEGAPTGAAAKGIRQGAGHGGGSDITGVQEDKAKSPAQ